MEPQKILDRLGPVQFEVTFVQSLRWAPGRHIAPHSHDREFHLDLFYGNGELTVGKQHFPLVGWTIVFIPPGINHSFTASRIGRLRNLAIKFQAGDSEFRALPALRFHPRTDTLRKYYENTLQLILEELQMRRWGWLQSVSARVTAMILQTLRVWQEEHEASAGQETLEKACRYLSLNFSEPVTIAEVARHCRLHPASLSRLFQRHLKTPPREYLLQLRLKQACLLLRSGHRVTDAADQTGFSSVHYFSRVFKKVYGNTPGTLITEASQAEYPGRSRR
jgi:AraC-like DNA-binding protein